MKTNKTSLYGKIVNFFRSKLVKNITISILIAFSVLFMFMLDDGNSIREQYLGFLENNFISKALEFFGISRFNIMLSAWLVFITVVFIIVVLVIANIFSEKFATAKSEANEKRFKSYAAAYRHYSLMFYIPVILLIAAVIFVTYMLGGYDGINLTTIDVFKNLLLAVLICLGFLLLIPITIIIAYLVIRAIIYVVSFILSIFVNVVRDINGPVENTPVSDNTAKVIHTPNGDAVVENKENIFLPLTLIDEEGEQKTIVDDQVKLEELALRFQSFAINNFKIYYELPVIRSYIAGLSAWRWIILEGLSGTGKSMFPRMFAEFTKCPAKFSPVQATWRDKTDLLGFYSEFSGTFKTTDFLRNLYSASYTDKINQMVLDEINISRIEYYFADFLSILEYPSNEWKIQVYDPKVGETLPAKLENGYISIPENTWFIGTANTDDSTFTITDKVYDRAIVIDFDEKFTPIESDYNSEPLNISSEGLLKLFEQAKNNEVYKLTKEDIDKFAQICEFVKDVFEVRFGNRIMVQIESFVPVYTALGGTKEQALDFMFARKILRKLGNAYQDYVKEELARLSKLIDSIYGKGVFTETEKLIAKITKRLV